jgi:uncharacterized protein YdcH (DUF465 family)
MNIESTKRHIKVLKERHRKQHSLVETLEAENAPEISIKNAKMQKLKLKDEIAALESAMQNAH